MNILVIGNGFDLAHDLKTSYKNFLEYCVERNSKRQIGLVNYGTTFIDNIWLRHFIIRKQELGNTWIDLEEEIYNVIETVTKAIYNLSGGGIERIFPLMFSIPKDVIDFDFSNICDYLETAYKNHTVEDKGYADVEFNDFSKLYTYIESYYGLINYLYDKLREFTKEFENYLNENICSSSTISSKYLLSLKTSNLYVLSFNYTDVCEVLYQYNCNISHQNLRMTPIYIHGKATKNDNCDLVLGTHSFKNIAIPVSFNVFKKHNQRHKYGTIETYQEFLRIVMQPNIRPIFHVVGHSLDKTDHNILKHAFVANKNAVINIYYHNEEAQERLINNITEIIGEEEVMTKVRMIYQHDKKRGILIPKE